MPWYGWLIVGGMGLVALVWLLVALISVRVFRSASREISAGFHDDGPAWRPQGRIR